MSKVWRKRLIRKLAEMGGLDMDGDKMSVQKVGLKEWADIEGGAIRVHEVKEAVIYDNGITTPKHVPSLRILVEYANKGSAPLKFRLSQWTLFDTEGFMYEFELRNQFYEDDAPRKLREAICAPQQHVKGWVAFQPTAEAVPSYVQFRLHYMTSAVVNIDLGKLR